MIGSLIGLVLGLLTILFTSGKELTFDPKSTGFFLMAFPAFIVLAYVMVYSLILPALHRAEQNTTPRLLDMFKKDPLLGFNHLGLIALPLLAIALGLVAALLPHVHTGSILGVWFLLVGICFDLLIQFIRRILSYLNPFAAVQLFRLAAKRSIQNDREGDLCDWIDALSEVGNRSLNRSGMSICGSVLNELYEIIRLFLGASKSIGHISEDKQSLALGIKDKVTFTLFFLLERLSMLFNQALEKRLEPICSNTLTTLGKIALESAKYDISLVSYPLQYIGKLGLDAHQKRLQDIGLKTVCLYLEVSKSILTEIDISYLELQEPFFTLIHHMDEITKESFKQNKEIPIKALEQPFYDLKSLFAEGKASTHQDTPKIVADIDRVIGEFDALAQVLRTIPPLSALTGELSQEAGTPAP